MTRSEENIERFGQLVWDDIVKRPGRKGESGKIEPLEGVSVGDSVLYNKFSGVDFEAKDGTALIVIKDHDILATLE